ncbi:hypothetical protein GE09DRAFT_1195219 [Coniochaeta sp. 2T2.1]|nr:hypothetical protein GE09DRAFT_1195219 [Coniochaeta sp. 2T2.1]
MRLDHILKRRLPRDGFTYDRSPIFAHRDGAQSIIDAINDILSIESAAYPSQVIMDDCLAEIFIKARTFIDQTDNPSLIGRLRSWELVTDKVSWTKDKVPAYNIADLAEYLVKGRMRYLEKAGGGCAAATNGFAGRTAMAVEEYLEDMRPCAYAPPLPTTKNDHVASRMNKTAPESQVANTHGGVDAAMVEDSAAGGDVPPALPLRPALNRKADDDPTDENQMPGKTISVIDAQQLLDV